MKREMEVGDLAGKYRILLVRAVSFYGAVISLWYDLTIESDGGELSIYQLERDGEQVGIAGDPVAASVAFSELAGYTVDVRPRRA